MYKHYPYVSRYLLPFERLDTFQSKIEWPLASENLALRHLKEKSPIGFWNHGILGEVLDQLKFKGDELPSSPLSHRESKIILPSGGGECENLYLLITFYESLDQVEYFMPLFDEVMKLKTPSKLHLGIEFIPRKGGYKGKFGIDELMAQILKRYSLEFFQPHQMGQMVFSSKDHFLHLHNRIFYYYSPFEVLAKMNGANLIFTHPEKSLSLAPDDKKILSFLERSELQLSELQLFLEYSISLNFKVKA